ncbi:MAG: DUF808 domain-containing protein [Rhizobiaceae bacterium]|jgi:hypothetical protein|nr:DUF808 domain-containing protein [Rhizobiaceae bacterium]
MAGGLIALLDDIAAIAKIAAASLDDVAAGAKVAASSLDDVAAAATKAGTKAAGIVIDDTAVTPRYVVGFSPDRELPIIWKIALGSLKNKLLFLLPGALLLSYFAPWAITPLLVAGGIYLCFEGFEKVFHMVVPHGDGHAPEDASSAADAQALEDEKVAGAIRTDFILSAEIMAITLASITNPSFAMKAFVLAVVGIGITALVYGVVALIVKADDFGFALARRGGPSASLGRGIVAAMPPLLQGLSLIGTAAMLWVGGGIVIHGLHEFGVHAPEDIIHHAAEFMSRQAPNASGLIGWLTTAALSGIAGLGIGLAAMPLATFVIGPLMRLLRPKTAH